jgi:hypothetical protein
VRARDDLARPAVLAAQQTRLLARYQPEGGFRAVTPDEPIYRGAFRVIAAIRLSIVGRKVKWKIGQNRAPEKRAASSPSCASAAARATRAPPTRCSGRSTGSQ